MLRRFAVVWFALALIIVVACGHQVTPSPTASDSNLSGKVVITFQTVGPINLSSYNYAIVIDTCGEGTPYPNVYGTSFDAYSYSFVVGPAYNIAFPVLFQYILTSTTTNNALNPQVVAADPNLESFQLNSNGQSNQFQLIFARAQLDDPLNRPQPCPNITPEPTTNPSMSSTMIPTGSESVATSPTSSPSLSPYSQPTTLAQQTWYFNFFSLDSTGTQVLDSLGIGGPSDDTYPGSPLNTAAQSNLQIIKVPGGRVPSDPSADIAGGEIENYP